MITLIEFYDLLEKADWFYEFSDDGRVYRQGSAEVARLSAIAKESPAHRQLYEAYKSFVFSGPAFDKPSLDKPPRPAK